MSSCTAPTVVQRSPARWRADAALMLVALIWGTTFVVVKQALTEISAMYFLALRFGLASACLLVIFLPSFRRSGLEAVGRGLRGGAIAGVFLWLGYVLQTFGLKYTSAGNSGFLTGLYIILVPLMSAGVYRRWPQPRELAGITAAGLGMVVLTIPSVRPFPPMNRGDVLTIGCAVAFAIHLLVLGYFSQRENFEAVAVGQIGCGAALSSICLVKGGAEATWGPALIFAIVLTGVFATAAAFALQTWGQRYTTPTRTALIFSLEPVFALATAVVAGGEALTGSKLVGGALILTGILAVELKRGARA